MRAMSIYDIPAIRPCEDIGPLGDCQFCGKPADNQCCTCGKSVCANDSEVAKDQDQRSGEVVRCEECTDNLLWARMDERTPRNVLHKAVSHLLDVWETTGVGSEDAIEILGQALKDVRTGWTEPRRVA